LKFDVDHLIILNYLLRHREIERIMLLIYVREV